MTHRLKIIALVGLLLFETAYGVRVKDVAALEGMRDFQITGFGLIVGLRNTGDGPRTLFTTKGIVNMLRNMGMEMANDRIRLRNVAAVMVVATIPPFLKAGSKIDVVVSSIGDARSLEGGTLLMSSLGGADGNIYAVAQGPISIGGYNVASQSGMANVRKNHALAGRVPNGAILQREIQHPSMPDSAVIYTLKDPDFSTAVYMAKAVNAFFKEPVARAENSGAVQILLPDSYKNTPLEFLADLENVEFSPSQVTRVVLNEKTGTIVAGGNISISPVAISHGNINITIKQKETNQQVVSQAPGRATQTSSRTLTEEANVSESIPEMKVLPNVSNVSELAGALNSLGVSPRDIISIFQSLKRAGALHAELVTM